MTENQPTREFDQYRDLPEEPSHRTTVDLETDSISTELIKAVATLYNADPGEVAVLADFVDPDALDALFQPRPDGTPRKAHGSVTFEYDSYIVIIKSSGSIAITQPDKAAGD